MLGVIGFVTLAITVGVYATLVNAGYLTVTTRRRRLFATSYYLLAISAVLWSATFFADVTMVEMLVFMSDALLLVATGCMLSVLLDITRPSLLLLIVTVGASLLSLRAYVYPPEAYVMDGLLYFNLAPPLAIGIWGIFLLVWLPATIKVVREAFRTAPVKKYRRYVVVLFVAVLLVTSIFLTTSNVMVLMGSFSAIVALFSLIVAANISLISVMLTKRSVGRS